MVSVRAPVAALNTYADPAKVAPASFEAAPTTTVLPDTATEMPNISLVAGVGLFSVAIKAPLVALNTYAEPASVAPVSSRGAPTATVFPGTAADRARQSWAAGV